MLTSRLYPPRDVILPITDSSNRQFLNFSAISHHSLCFNFFHSTSYSCSYRVSCQKQSHTVRHHHRHLASSGREKEKEIDDLAAESRSQLHLHSSKRKRKTTSDECNQRERKKAIPAGCLADWSGSRGIICNVKKQNSSRTNILT